MNRSQILDAAAFCRREGLPLRGLHFHLGSQFRDPTPLRPAIETALDLAQAIGFSAPWHFSPGGGWGVAYHEDDLPHPDLDAYVCSVAAWTLAACRQRGLDLPQLHLEPGRSLAARAGVAIYRVGTVKAIGDRLWLLVDGGLADNPRPALYRARYSCLTVNRPLEAPTQTVSIAGPFCESGDILIESIALRRVEEGELLAVPMSGAYQLSMASNYNGARRPAVVLVDKGAARPIEQRETSDDLLRRQI